MISLPDYIEIKVSDVNASKRLRPVNEDKAQVLARAIAEHGQLQPIIVTKTDESTYLLIAGGHRLRAMQILERPMISAKLVAPRDGEEALMMEIGENLRRVDLDPIDRAVFLAEWKAIYERLHPETKQGAQGGRGSKTNETDAASFSKYAAKQLNLDERSIRRSVAVCSIPRDELERLRGTDASRNAIGASEGRATAR